MYPPSCLTTFKRVSLLGSPTEHVYMMTYMCYPPFFFHMPAASRCHKRLPFDSNKNPNATPCRYQTPGDRSVPGLSRSVLDPCRLADARCKNAEPTQPAPFVLNYRFFMFSPLEFLGGTFVSFGPGGDGCQQMAKYQLPQII